MTITDFDGRALRLFRAAISFLKIDDEGCAPSEFSDVVAASNLCADIRIWCYTGMLPTLAQNDAFFEAVDALEMVLATYVVIAPDNTELVARWRTAHAAIAELGAA